MVENLKTEQPGMIEELYCALRKEYIKKDALAYIGDDAGIFAKTEDDYTEEQIELADAIAERYAYEGDYDCTLSYWQNIENLYDDITTSDMDSGIVLD